MMQHSSRLVCTRRTSRTQIDSFWDRELLRDESGRGMQRAPRSREQRFDLKAARLTAQTPFAEVLAVVGQ
jgi:hypothetical protein